MKKILTKKGFTLIELIVVIAILAILAAILIPSLTNYLAKATQAKDQANARSYYSAVVLEVATLATAPSNGDYNPTAAITVPCSNTTTDVTITSGAVSAFSCTIGGFTYSAPAFTPTAVTP